LHLAVTLADVERLRGVDQELVFTTAAEPEHLRRWRPALVLGHRPRAFLNSYFGPHGQVPWAGLITVQDALVFGDGLVVDRLQRLLCGDSLMYPQTSFPYAHSPVEFIRTGSNNWEADITDVRIRLDGVTALLVCDGWPIYGHWLIDILPRLSRLMASGIAFDHFLLPAPLVTWQRDMLAVANVPLDRCREVNLRATPVRCETLVVPSYERFGYEARPTLTDIFDTILAKLSGPPRPERDIFVARPAGNARHLTNRAEVEEVVASEGYEIVHPEQLSFAEQVQTFNTARSMLGEFGSGMHNSLLAPRGARVGLLQSAENTNLVQSQLAMIRQQDVFYALGSPGPDDSYTMDLNDVRRIASIMRTF
jgi:capsular polysaccharide biosynthesis protein